MSGNSDKSFDFSVPYHTVEVEPHSSDAHFSQKFEYAKHNTVPDVQAAHEALSRGKETKIGSTRKKNYAWVKRLVVFTCLLATSLSATYLLGQHRQEQVRVADANRLKNVAGASAGGSVLITTPVFSVSTNQLIAQNYTVTKDKIEYLTGFDRNFAKASLLNGTEPNVSGIEVLMQEKSVGLTNEALFENIKRAFPANIYSYPQVLDTNAGAYTTLTPSSGVSPTILITQTTQSIYIIRKYTQVANQAMQVHDLVNSLKLN